MKTNHDILDQVRAALEREPRINLHRFPIALDFSEGVLTLDGDVENIIAKRLALRLAHESGAMSVKDDLRIIPLVAKGDGEIGQTFGELLLNEPDLKNCSIRNEGDVGNEVLHVADEPETSGEIRFRVVDGTISIEGHLISLSHRRVAELLAWWVPGCRQVRNRLRVVPPEQNDPTELRDAIVLALELDPRVHAEQIAVGTTDGEVILGGMVEREDERHRAELDTWYIAGVHEVVNRITVQAQA